MTRARDLAAGTFELATGGVLKLETSDTTVTDGSVLGKIEFKAPDEASGTDAILVGAAIEAVAEGTFAADNNATELVFKTGASAAADAKMILDSSGNLLVGTTDTTLYDNSTGTGTKIGGDGRLDVSRSADTVATFNRTGSSDGEIIRIVSSGTTIGAIGTGGGRPYFVANNGSNGGGFKVDSTQFYPVDRLGAVSNGVLDLGFSSGRWKDFYLSGGVYLGGTGAANKLDDYEEGVLSNPTITPQTSGSITPTAAYSDLAYTKIGRQVTVTGAIDITSVSSPVGTYVSIELPFTVGNLAENSGHVMSAVGRNDNSTGVRSVLKGLAIEGTTDLRAYIDASTIAVSDDFYIGCTYFTA